jgi:hypothetical protein
MSRFRRRFLVAALFACVLTAGPSPLAGSAAARSDAFTLRVFVNGNGTVKGSGVECGAKGSVCGVSYALGTTVTIQATPEEFSVFAGWAGACEGVGDTCTLTAGDPTTVTATFSYIEVVDVNKLGEGAGTVVSYPGGVNCGNTCSAPFTGNTRVTLVAHAAPGSVFMGWNGYCKGKDQCVLQQAYGTMPVTAQFEPRNKKGKYTPPAPTGTGGKGGGTTSAFTAAALGSAAKRTPAGRVISVGFSSTRAATVRLQIWRAKKLISQAKVSVQPGRATVNLPFANGYPGGLYDVWGVVKAKGEKPKLLRWHVTVPR